jgi:hypothetical protein
VEADTTFGGLSPEDWDKLAGDHFYSTSAWLRFCTAEAGTPGGAVLSRVGGDPAWAVPTRELAGLPSWSRYWWNSHLAESGLPLLPPQGMLVGPPEGFQTHLLAPTAGRSTAALGTLVDDLRRLTGQGDRTEERACVAMYVTTDDVRSLHAAGVSAHPVLLDADAWIPVPEGGWPDWLETLPAKRSRTIRREDRAFWAAGYQIAEMPLADCVEQIGVAAAATLHKYGHETTPETELVSLRRVVEWMGDAARVSVLSVGDGAPVGFCIYYVWGETVYLRWAGFDYDRLVGSAEYFNLLYYNQVRRAPERGVRWIHAGATAQAAKALRGAELRPLWLLDLTEDSVLATAAEQVRQHNAGVHARFADDPRTAPALVPGEDWATFC